MDEAYVPLSAFTWTLLAVSDASILMRGVIADTLTVLILRIARVLASLLLNFIYT